MFCGGGAFGQIRVLGVGHVDRNERIKMKLFFQYVFEYCIQPLVFSIVLIGVLAIPIWGFIALFDWACSNFPTATFITTFIVIGCIAAVGLIGIVRDFIDGFSSFKHEKESDDESKKSEESS